MKRNLFLVLILLMIIQISCIEPNLGYTNVENNVKIQSQSVNYQEASAIIKITEKVVKTTSKKNIFRDANLTEEEKAKLTDFLNGYAN